MDPTLTDFPVLSYVMFGSAGPIYPVAPPGAAYDIEQPPQPPSPPSTFVDPLIERMPHLKDPKIIATMSEAVTEIAQTRSVLQTLGERPDHETIDIAKAKLARIEGDPSQELEEILLTPRPSNEAERARRESLEREKEKYRAIIKLDEMHKAYQKMLRDAEEKLMKIYDSSVVENGGDEEEEEEENDLGFDEEVVRVLQQEEIMIERVDLCGRKLRVLPEAFGKLHALVSLNLAGNLLQAIPDSIAGLGNLEELNLSHNSLESLPDSIGLLLNLKYLNVPGNKLSALPDSISHCRSLVELDASFNTLSYLPTNIGYELVHLRKLLVPYNKIRSLPSSIGELKSLQHLDLLFNELHGLPITIGKLTNLVTLNLSGNFSDLKELPESFGELINLEDLDLSNNQIHALPDSFFNLEKLVKLNLDQNPITIPPVEVVNDGVESVRTYMAKRWADLIEEEEEMKRQQMQEESEPGWLTRSVSKLGEVVSSVSEYLGSPRTSRDPCLDQEL